MPQLCARLGELSDALTSLGPGADPYSRTFPGREVPVDNSAEECLEPYRSLDADRLKLSGTGEWDPTPFLGDTLCMAFRNPDCSSLTWTTQPSHYRLSMTRWSR